MGVSDREYFERLLKEIEKRYEQRFREQDKALQLQAAEYSRRLTALNHAHEQAVEVQHTYVTQDKYEDKLLAEEQARIQALQRVDERFEDYVKRYEARQREVDVLLAAQKGAAEAARVAAEEQGRKSVRASEEQGRKNNRNIAIVGLALTLIIAFANFWGSQEAQSFVSPLFY